jgi:dipeptidyl aminopeptidase/acylaminoacyl peptidase
MSLFYMGNTLKPKYLLITLSIFLLIGCSKQVEIIDREILFGTPDYYYPSVSMDGEHLIYFGSNGDFTSLWISDLNGGKKEDRVLIENAANVYNTKWDATSEKVLYQRDSESGAILSSIDINSGFIETVVQKPKSSDHFVTLDILKISQNCRYTILFMANIENAADKNLYGIERETGKLELIKKGFPTLLEWKLDSNCNLTGYVQSEDDGGQSFWIYDKNGKAEKQITWFINDDSSMPLEYTKDNKKIYMRDSRGRDKVALTLYDLKSAESEVILTDEQQDVMQLLWSDKYNTVQAVMFNRGNSLDWVVIDESIKQDIDFLVAAREGRMYVSNRSYDEDKWVVVYVRNNASPVFYLYTRNVQKLTKLFATRNNLAGLPLARTKATKFKSRDNVDLCAHLTLPPGKSGPYPMVLMVQKNYPWNQARVGGFNPEVQWLANRGYAVLMVDTRGTIGFGKEFLNAGNREWAGVIQNDLTDAVKWAIEEKIADEDRVAIYGGSYGGYAALMGAALTPGLFSAAISVVGYVDMVDYLSSIPPYWSAYTTNMNHRVGRIPRYGSGSKEGEIKESSDWTKEDVIDIKFLKSISPAYHSNLIKTPLMVVQGGKDILASKKSTEKFLSEILHSMDMVDELKKLDYDSPQSHISIEKENRYVEYLVYKNAYHGLSSPEDRMHFYRLAEEFLAKHLGGRYQK